MVQKNGRTFSALTLTSLILLSLPLMMNYASAQGQEKGRPITPVKKGLNFDINTDMFTVKFAGSEQVPKFQYWYNKPDGTKNVTQVFFHQVFEFNDTDEDGIYNATNGDKKEQTFALPSANLSLTEPEYIYMNGYVVGVQFNFTMLGNKGGLLSEVNMTLRCSLYNVTHTITGVDGTLYNVTGNAELKIDVIIDIWPFKDDGNRLCMWWSVNQQNMTQEPSITENSVTFGRGYFSWISKATVYSETSSDTKDVIGSFNMTDKTVNVYLSYPNFKDKKLIHDPSLGVNPLLQVSGSLSKPAVTLGEEVTVSVVVEDEYGNAVEGATVTAASDDTTIELSDKGNGNYEGRIETSNLREGTYNIIITTLKDGYIQSQYSTTLSVEAAVQWAVYGMIGIVAAAVAITAAIMLLKRKQSVG